MKVCSLILLFFALGFESVLPFAGGSENLEKVSDYTWRRCTGKDEEFSVLMPGEPSLYLSLITNKGKHTLERIYSTYDQGSVYLVVSYDATSIKGTLENFKAHHLYEGDISYERDISVSGFTGKEYKLKFNKIGGVLQIYATKKHGYAVAVIQAIDHSELKDYFLSSFLLTANGDESKVDPTQTRPPLVNQVFRKSDPGQLPPTDKLVDRKQVVISKPEPWYTEDARQAGITGTVVLRVVLSSTGEVTNIRVIRGLPKGLTENAIEAARHLRFIPGVKDDHFVSYWVQLEYNFSLY